MAQEPQERKIETRFEIDAPVEDVWRALTDAEWLTNWFPTEARIKPGVGGSVWTSWGGETSFESPITAWEANKHLRLLYLPATPPEQAEEAKAQGMYLPFEVAVDYFLEDAGGSTVLRLVHHGFSDDSAWDSQYDGTVRGWQFELRGLKHYLEKHRGEKRTLVQANHDLTGVSLEDAWQRVFSAEGLLVEGIIDGLKPGDRYSFTTTGGDTFEGEVHMHSPPKDFCGTVEGLNDALLKVKLDEPCFTAPKQQVHLFVATFGLPQEETDALRERLQSMLDELFGAMVESK